MRNVNSLEFVCGQLHDFYRVRLASMFLHDLVGAEQLVQIVCNALHPVVLLWVPDFAVSRVLGELGFCSRLRLALFGLLYVGISNLWLN